MTSISGQAANRVQPFIEVSWDLTTADLLLWPANKHEQLSEVVAKKSTVCGFRKMLSFPNSMMVWVNIWKHSPHEMLLHIKPRMNNGSFRLFLSYFSNSTSAFLISCKLHRYHRVYFSDEAVDAGWTVKRLSDKTASLSLLMYESCSEKESWWVFWGRLISWPSVIRSSQSQGHGQ